LKSIDIISVGEVLIDLIGHEINSSINRTKNYHRFLGGSPTNVAVNASRLGLNSLLVATCGEDGLGDYAVRKLKANNVDTSCIRKTNKLPTSVIFISKSTTTPEFIPFRQADYEIKESQLPDSILSQAKIFHTTCFALSKNPARQTILNRSKRAKELGLKLSIDINFSEKIWPNREEAKSVIKDYLSNDPLVKVSEDDCYRLFTESKSEDFIFDYFHKLGAKTICLTKGSKGVSVSDINQGLIFQEAIQIDGIMDTTGAGDAFWTGFLFAQIENKNLEDSITIAQKLAAIKLQNVGRLPDGININSIISK
jgi:fructokinase